MGNYMSSVPPKVKWSTLIAEVHQLGEDFDFEVAIDDMEGGYENFERCLKYPGHKEMSSVPRFTLDKLPEDWQIPQVYSKIINWSNFVVKVVVGYVSPRRPDNYHFSHLRGEWIRTVGSGCAAVKIETSRDLIDCPLLNCSLPKPHKVTSFFQVRTAKHVVYDNLEAENTFIEFFYNTQDEADIVRAEVVDISGGEDNSDFSALKCVSHNCNLFSEVVDRTSLPTEPFRPCEKNKAPLVVVISHPHGVHKHISIGQLDSWDFAREWIVKEMTHRISKTLIEVCEYVLTLCDDTVDDDAVFEWLIKVLKKTGLSSEYSEKTDFTVIGQSDNIDRKRVIEERGLKNVYDCTGLSAEELSHNFLCALVLIYTAATCPGSSGGQGLVFFQGSDSDGAKAADDPFLMYHFRGGKKAPFGQHYLNASGNFVSNLKEKADALSLLSTVPNKRTRTKMSQSERGEYGRNLVRKLIEKDIDSLLLVNAKINTSAVTKRIVLRFYDEKFLPRMISL